MKEYAVHFYDLEDEKTEETVRTGKRSRTEAIIEAAKQSSPEATAETDRDSRAEAHLDTGGRVPTETVTPEWKEDMAALGSALKDELTAIRSTITEKTVTMGTNVTEALATISGDIAEEMSAIKSNIKEIQTGIASLHSAIHNLKEPLGINAERMVKFVQQQTFQTQFSTPTEIPGATAQGTQSVFLSPAAPPSSNMQHSPTKTALTTMSDDPPLPLSKRPKALPRKPGP